jgi:hypothetical protein
VTLLDSFHNVHNIIVSEDNVLLNHPLAQSCGIAWEMSSSRAVSRESLRDIGLHKGYYQREIGFQNKNQFAREFVKCSGGAKIFIFPPNSDFIRDFLCKI